MIPLLIILGVVVVLVLWFVGAYNGLVQSRNQVKNSWSQIDVQLKRRHDLIPNLVETAKGYVTHERGTLEAVTNARAAAMKAQGAGQAAQAEGLLGSALSKFFAIAENYPELKANQNFLAIQEELASTENKIGFARQFYNDSVMAFNTKIESIPTNIVAGIGGFQKAEFFELQDAAQREVPQVKF
ncbi:MAG: LemA family protein [Verrucomicrobia bacterium]|nr:MAG: LemA family protein [Verrucomicrobiota bacterium]